MLEDCAYNSLAVVDKSDCRVATSGFNGSGLLNTTPLQNKYSAANFHLSS